MILDNMRYPGNSFIIRKSGTRIIKLKISKRGTALFAYDMTINSKGYYIAVEIPNGSIGRFYSLDSTYQHGLQYDTYNGRQYIFIKYKGKTIKRFGGNEL